MKVSRRGFMGLVIAGPVLAGARQPSAARARSASGVAAVLPAVDMEAVVKAAQWDPVKADSGLTAGAGPSVRLVEAALRDRGLLEATYVDGHFGTRTIAAYAQWQEQLAFTGIGATGLPGKISPTALGDGRFTIARPLSPGARSMYQGCPVNARTLAMLRAAQARSSLAFVVEQGSYSPAVDPTSAGTHDGGGRARPRRRTPDQDPTPRGRHRALRQVGFAAWLRTPAQGDWPLHIHAVAISDTDLSAPAQKQVGACYEGRNGLADDLPDDGPQVSRVTYEEYLRRR